MKKYPNNSGNSGVSAFEIGADYIVVRFIGGNAYRYTYGSAGMRRIETMKKLAIEGKGLSTYISRYVREMYEDF